MSAKLDIIQALHEEVQANRIEIALLRLELSAQDKAVEFRDAQIKWLNYQLERLGSTHNFSLDLSRRRESDLKERVEMLQADVDKTDESFL